jgi:hypothetical protein
LSEESQIDFVAEGLLDGLEGVQRAERLALLRYLAADGVPLAELRRTTDSGTLMFLPAERVIGGQARYSAREIAERTGTELDFLIAVRRAMGCESGAIRPVTQDSLKNLGGDEQLAPRTEAGMGGDDVATVPAR